MDIHCQSLIVETVVYVAKHRAFLHTPKMSLVHEYFGNLVKFHLKERQMQRRSVNI